MKLTKIFLFLICFSFFSYQFFNVTKSYLGYQTNTRIRYESEDVPMPAFYFCLRHPFTARQMFDYLKMGTHKTSIGELDYDLYKRELGNLNNTQFYDYLLKKYLERVEKGKLKEMLIYPMSEELDFSLLVFDVLFKNGTKVSLERIDRNLREPQRNLTFAKELVKYKTFTFLTNLLKCFAFFYDNSLFSVYQNLFLTSFAFRFYHRSLMLDFESKLLLAYSMAFVGSREIPREDDSFFVEPEFLYLMTLRLNIIEKLEAPFDTDCKKYKEIENKNEIEKENEVENKNEKDFSFQNMNSRSKCMSKCIFEFLNPNLTDNSTLYSESFYLVSADWIKSRQRVNHLYFNKYKLSINFYKQSENYCRRQCPADCDQTEYFLTASRFKKRSNLTKLYVKTPSYYTKISHHPDFTFLSYFGTVGGIAGVWLGISCYQISAESFAFFANYFVYFWRNIKQKFRQNKFFLKNA